MIIVECNNDEFILRTLGVGKKKIRHESCKGDVLRIAKKNSPVLSLIDADPDSAQPRELDNYRVEIDEETIKLCCHIEDPKRRLVIVSPHLEHWLLIRARKTAINPKEFGLPDEPKKLKSIPHLDKNPGFKEFVGELIRKDKEFALIQKWIAE